MKRIVCPVCGNIVMRYPSQEHLKTCSKKCGSIIRHINFVEKSQRECALCGKFFVPKHSKSKGLFCSYRCAGEYRRKPFVLRKGYKYLLLPNHPNATRQGYFAEHRYVVERDIGRRLDRSEIIHHINHNKSDNRIENLMILNSPGKHTVKYHPPNWQNGKYRKKS